MRWVLAFAALLPMAAQASLTANISYFKIDSNDPDANHLCCSGPLAEVQNNLGPDGLPMLLPGYGGIVPHDVNGAGELTYWSPGFNGHVTPTGSATVSLPFSNSHMYNPNGTGGADGGSNGFLSAIISATLSTPVAETVSFTISSDDNAFVFVDGLVVCNDGGVHGAGAVLCTSQTLSAGNHSLQVFYDDLNTTGAVLDFTVNTENVSTTPPPANGVPEPASLALAGSALLMAGLAGRKTRR
ncbi:PEP-CTERM sorting domain-containing protein [Roseateles saccharophilus]|nr:PEP-CTERM sorting domain-containing protein [Roseateles saccharophilus]